MRTILIHVFHTLFAVTAEVHDNSDSFVRAKTEESQKSVSSSSNSSTSTDEGICQDDAILEDDEKRDSDTVSTPQSSRKAPSSVDAASSASSTTACSPEDDEMDTAAGRTTIFHSSQLNCKSPTLVKSPNQNQTVLKTVAKTPTPKASPPMEPKVPSQAILRPTPCSAILREAQPLPLRGKSSSLADLLGETVKEQQSPQPSTNQQQPAAKKSVENGLKKASSTLSLLSSALQVPPPPPPAADNTSCADVSGSDSDYETICTVSTYKEDKAVKALRPPLALPVEASSKNTYEDVIDSAVPPPPSCDPSPPPPPPPPPRNQDVKPSCENTLKRSTASLSGDCRSETSSNADTEDSGSSSVHSEERTLPRLFERPLSFIPPQFMQPPDSDTNLKPSEYLKTVSNRPKSVLVPKELKVDSMPRKLGKVLDNLPLPTPPQISIVSSPVAACPTTNGTNGTSGTTNGTSNGQANGTVNGATNGTAGAITNGSNGSSTANGLSGLNGSSTLNGTTNGQNGTNGNCDESPTASLCEEKVRSNSTSHTDGDVSSSSSVKSMPSTPCSPQPNGGVFSITKEQLQNVQLKRTDKPSTIERCVLLQKNGGALLEQKSTIIEELKQSMDGQGVHGVRKMKEERLRMEEEKEKKKAEELLQQISAKNFVDTIPEKDVNGCVIPAWKRQMLAKKAAEKARKEAEEVLQREAEAKKWTSVPVWKRQLLMKNGDSTLPGHKTLGNKPLTASLSCPATPTQTLPQPVMSSQPATPSPSEGPSEAVPASQDRSLVIEEDDKPPNPFLQQGLRKVNREAEAKKWTSVPVWKRQLLMKNGDSTLPGHKTLGNKPLTASLSCPATPTQTLPQPVMSSQPATPSPSEGPSEAVPASQDRSLVIEEDDKPPNPFLQQGLRKVNVRLH
ncbi:hyphally regulated cell wall protein 3 [Ixodes scapularis]